MTALRRLVFVFGLAALASCQSLSSIFQRSTMGADYFAAHFECKRDLEAESDERIQALRLANFQLPFARDLQSRSGRGAAVVVTGDSIAALFLPDLSARLLPGVDLANRGIPGDTTAMLLKRLDSDIVPLQPRLVAISIGGNDILMGRCLDFAIENTRSLIARLRSRLPGVRIALISVPPTVAERPNRITPFYNQKLRRLSDAANGVYFVDLWPALSREERPELREEFRIPLGPGYDLVHFNAEGYAVLARLLQPLITNQP